MEGDGGGTGKVGSAASETGVEMTQKGDSMFFGHAVLWGYGRLYKLIADRIVRIVDQSKPFCNVIKISILRCGKLI